MERSFFFGNCAASERAGTTICLSRAVRFSYYYYLFLEMGSYPTFWLTMLLTNVMAIMPIFVMKWWLMQ